MIQHCTATDASRVNGKVHKNILSTNRRLCVGWAGEQRPQYSKDFRKRIKIPTITNLGEYRKLPVPLKAGLFIILEQATQLMRRKYPSAMSDSLPYTKLFVSRFNSNLGKPNSFNRFEYVGILLLYNTVLPSHVDEKTIIAQDMITVRWPCLPCCRYHDPP